MKYLPLLALLLLGGCAGSGIQASGGAGSSGAGIGVGIGSGIRF